MRTSLHGGNEPAAGAGGFILLRGLLVMFIVIICFASALAAMAVMSRQSSRLLENAQREITRQNEAVMRRFANEN